MTLHLLSFCADDLCAGTQFISNHKPLIGCIECSRLLGLIRSISMYMNVTKFLNTSVPFVKVIPCQQVVCCWRSKFTVVDLGQTFIGVCPGHQHKGCKERRIVNTFMKLLWEFLFFSFKFR